MWGHNWVDCSCLMPPAATVLPCRTAKHQARPAHRAAHPQPKPHYSSSPTCVADDERRSAQVLSQGGSKVKVLDSQPAVQARGAAVGRQQAARGVVRPAAGGHTAAAECWQLLN